MQKSESIINLTKALAIFHSQKGKISKDAKNPFFKSSYASLPHILTEIQDPMEKAGLVISQFPDGDALTTMLIHAESGEFISSSYVMPIVKANDPQALGSAISYGRRYAITSILNLAIADDDGEAATKPTREQEDARPWLNKGESLNKAMEMLRTGQVTIEQIEKKYKLSKEIRASLEALINNLNK